MPFILRTFLAHQLDLVHYCRNRNLCRRRIVVFIAVYQSMDTGI